MTGLFLATIKAAAMMMATTPYAILLKPTATRDTAHAE